MQNQDLDARIAEEFAAGRGSAEIAARYNVALTYVDRVIEDVMRPRKSRAAPGLANRVVLAILATVLLWLVSGEGAVALIGGFAVFGLLSVLAGQQKRK
ncbi:hypothetical protein [Actinoplanes sp. NPDC051851]|uniref:hypothetical protein n=1 Tax=Actinoplanes sp. NPDC051851 TaxID=3154753 RepID=UPI003413A67C